MVGDAGHRAEGGLGGLADPELSLVPDVLDPGQQTGVGVECPAVSADRAQFRVPDEGGDAVPYGVRRDDAVRVGEQQYVPVGDGAGADQRALLAEVLPQPDQGERQLRGEAFQYVRCAVVGGVVDHDELHVGVVHGGHGAHAGLDVRAFVAHGQQEAHPGLRGQGREGLGVARAAAQRAYGRVVVAAVGEVEGGGRCSARTARP